MIADIKSFGVGLFLSCCISIQWRSLTHCNSNTANSNDSNIGSCKVWKIGIGRSNGSGSSIYCHSMTDPYVNDMISAVSIQLKIKKTKELKNKYISQIVGLLQRSLLFHWTAQIESRYCKICEMIKLTLCYLRCVIYSVVEWVVDIEYNIHCDVYLG